MSEERNSNDVEDKISIKEIHETFWRCRDFELSHLWQRSIKKIRRLVQYFPESCIYIYEYTKENFIHNLLIPRLNLYFSMGKFPKQRLCL